MTPTRSSIEWLSIGDAAKHLGVSRDTLRRWERRGRLKSYRTPGGRRRYTKYDLELAIKPSKGGHFATPKPQPKGPKPGSLKTIKPAKKEVQQPKAPPPQRRLKPSPMTRPKRSRTSTFSAVLVTLLMITLTIVALLALTGLGNVFPLYLKPAEGILKPLL